MSIYSTVKIEMNRTLNKQIAAAKAQQTNKWALEANPTDPLRYNLVIIPPKESLYHPGVFYFELTFQPGYPFYPPAIKATTKIFHPNISVDPNHFGCLCVEFLLSEWKMNVTVLKVIEYVYGMFLKPDLDYLSVANHDAEELYLNDYKQYTTIVNEWVKKYAV